jgi:hypothetical protein
MLIPLTPIRADAVSTPADWYSVRIEVTTPVDVQSFDLLISEHTDEYHVVGRSNLVDGTWSVYFDGTEQRVATVAPGQTAATVATVHDNDNHIAAAAWRVARRGTSGSAVGTVLRSRVDTTILIRSVTPMSNARARARVASRPERGLPEVAAARRSGTPRSQGDAAPSRRVRGFRSAPANLVAHGSGSDSSVVTHRTIYNDMCTRNYNNFRYSDHRAYAYSQITNPHYDCYWTDMSLWEGGAGGQLGGSCHSVQGIAFGPTSSAISSGTGWPGEPDKGQICSNSAAYSSSWVLTVPWEGNMNWV